MANLKLMFNNVGWNCDVLTARIGSVATGYDINNLLSGPRSAITRWAATTTNTMGASWQVSNYTTTPTKFLEASHVIITRWDKWVNHQYASDELRMLTYGYQDGGFVNYQSYNQVGDTTWDLMGPTEQDYCFSINSGTVELATLWELQTIHGAGSTSWSVETGPVYWCNPFDPGRGPDVKVRPRWTTFTET